MPKEHLSLFVLGTSGSGKSYFVLYTLEQIHNSKQYVIIIDPKQEFSGLIKLNFKQTLITTDLLKKLSVDNCVKIMQANPKLLVTGYLLSWEEEARMAENFAAASLALGNTLFVVDEASRILPNVLNLKDQRYLYGLSTMGRSQSVDSIFVIQKVALISKVTYSQANAFCVFKLHDILDIQRVSFLIGKSKEEIASLRPREYYYYDSKTDKSKLLTTNGLRTKTKHGG